MKKKESNFIQNLEVINLDEGTNIILRSFPNNRALPCEVSISAFGKEKKFHRLAWLETIIIENDGLKFVPKLLYILNTRPNPFLYIIGLDRIIFVRSGDKAIQEVSSLNRKESDDYGFYRMDALLLENSFVLIYEGGAMRLDENGNVIWHQYLMWDDIYLGNNDKFLFYSSEFGDFAPDDWVISIETGEKTKLISRQ